jgi:hypothetical protein
VPPLFQSAIEQSLDLLEKNGALVPFCKATVDSPHAFYIAHDSDDPYTVAEAIAAIRSEIESRRAQIHEFALCSEVSGRRDDEPQDTHFLKVEYQSKEPGATVEGIYYFPILTESGRLSLKTYDRFDLKEKII